MNRLRSKLSWWRRRLFGSYRITDPRSLAESAPYTFFLPSENEVLALRRGDLAKLIFQSVPASTDYAAERMWVVITLADGDHLIGQLDNAPIDMPQLRPGSEIRFRRGDVIDLRWGADRPVRPPSAPARRHYEERCLVDSCVLRDGLAVHYLYREAGLPHDEGESPDSGWRIRGDFRAEADDAAIDARRTEWTTIGHVLNADDSWVSLVDAPVGSAYVRNWQSNRFEPESAAAD
ncbi:immunity protein Imm33 domain-containing protein [Sphingomonas sp. HT-1]|uniref:immunity protein Imm33 domain-containing protein n=1 Tax=unclassified Sphingomonas TaxID=196159 RepID=UPI000360788E|nr:MULTISPECIES: DUF2185 domain-containing protein [unclassified Sphingomonas]KTF69208.1 hypothetical protein ATB93_10110 [Sphingomonas sp. WG]